MKEYFYLVAHGGEGQKPIPPIKVVRTIDLTQRLRLLRTGNPSIIGYYAIWNKLSYLYGVEAHVTYPYRGNRCSGGREWYDVPPEVLFARSLCVLDMLPVYGPADIIYLGYAAWSPTI